ncbi:hypothetical protein GH714_002474 [Hevea brasiliensis]|uniref:TF-B3 domain-containing protein n=1 Tax=Hevea brasiliensis TaxID=3981 RepID=A0A6A6LDK9_HEVBR|nr:hypothetical protein GH714_002474 [Hevea brasiliensis]
MFFAAKWVVNEQERRVLDAYKTKVARSKRKLARQRSLSKNSSSGANSSQVDTRRLSFNGASNKEQDCQSFINRDLYKICTPDNKRLRVLLSKELKNSDVGSLGRIVLPKRGAEENLPILSDKEGIQVVIRDVNSTKEWSLKFKFWSNNKSRMYVLENTGDFVKQNGLEMGDSLTLYEDECKNLQEANSLVTLSVDIASSYRRKEDERIGPLNNITSISFYPQPAPAAVQSSSSPHSITRILDDHYIDDCYTGLGVLPDVNRSEGDYGAAKVTLRPASPGTGVIAGGAVRIILEMAGVENPLGKQLGMKANGNKNKIQSLIVLAHDQCMFFN